MSSHYIIGHYTVAVILHFRVRYCNDRRRCSWSCDFRSHRGGSPDRCLLQEERCSRRVRLQNEYLVDCGSKRQLVPGLGTRHSE